MKESSARQRRGKQAVSPKLTTPGLLDTRLMLRVKEFSDLTGTPRATVYALLYQGKIEGACRIGQSWRIPVASVRQLQNTSMTTEEKRPPVKAELRLKAHAKRGQMGVPDDANVIEVYYAGQLVCAVYGADGPGIRVISKHPAMVRQERGGVVDATQVMFPSVTVT